MPRTAKTSRVLEARPFRGSVAIDAGLLTWNELRGPAWRRLLPDVYVHPSAYHPDDHRMWCDAVTLNLPKGSCLGGWSAASLRGLDILPREAQVWVNLPLPVRMRPRNRVYLKRTPLGHGDVEMVKDAPLTTAVRTAFDLARHLPRTDALVAMDAHCHRLVNVAELEMYATDRWDWPGTRQLRSLLPLVEPLTESPMETRLRLHIADAGLPKPIPQFEVRGLDGRFLARVDFAYPEWQIAIEYEGDHHREAGQFRRDIERQNTVEEEGWLVIRVTAEDMFRYPQRLTRRIVAAIDSRRR